MSYEEAETIKAVVLIALCVPPVVVLIIQGIISAIEDRKYRKELKESKILAAERRAKKLENLKLENFTLSLKENEFEMLEDLANLNSLNRNQFLRKSIKEIVREEC
ncbi:hypothetical protein [uncultured Clostridium sp.]|uniref:hypothetical protein n=1 Tax=uncultured Clostridium sp. TaxID=59620 RepID=UPI0025F6DF35|nr:hypothetical protein [uncultured Clostridium sp.]MDU4882676.1 hypothetical protein [Clostridium celatum]MDU7076055.1 hypothetical protein [Clostridium celatum]